MSDPNEPTKIMVFKMNDSCCTSQANRDLTFEFFYANTTKKIIKILSDELLKNLECVQSLSNKKLNSFVDFIVGEGVVSNGSECGCGIVISISEINRPYKLTISDFYKLRDNYNVTNLFEKFMDES
jgi:hypothetical protein